MASQIKLKRSSVLGNSPTFGTEIVEGELALNTADQKLYSANSTSTFTLADLSSAVRGDNVDNGLTNIRVDNTDFIVSDSTDSPSYFIWRDHDVSKLYLGTPTAVITARSDILPSADNTYDLGSASLAWSDVFARQYTSENNVDRVKYGVWEGNSYGMGMDSLYTFGGLGPTDGYAVTFQMTNSPKRGFWWGDTAHTNAQGAMSLTTEGKLYVADSIRVGDGESDTTTPGGTAVLEVNSSGFVDNKSAITLRSDDTVQDQALDAASIRLDTSGSTVPTADRTKSTLRLDGNHTGTGSTTTVGERVNLYGLINHMDNSGDPNGLTGIYNLAQSNHTTGTIPNQYAIYNLTGGDHAAPADIGNTYAAYNRARLTSSGDMDYLYGAWNSTQFTSTSSGNTITSTASQNEFLIAAGSSSTVTNARASVSLVNIDDGTVGTPIAQYVYMDIEAAASVTNNSYLLFGTYTADSTINVDGTAYGVYISGEEDNYFSGKVGIGTTTPTQALDVNGTLNIGDGNTRLNIHADGTDAEINYLNNSDIVFKTNSVEALRITDDTTILSSSHIIPNTTDITDLGSTSLRWREIYTNGIDVSTTNENRSLNLTTVDTVQDQDLEGALIQIFTSGSDSLTGINRSKASLRVYGSHTGTGGSAAANDQIYIRGLRNDHYNTGDPYQIYALYNIVQSSHTTGTVTTQYGIYSASLANHTSPGVISTVHGVFSDAQVKSSGAATNVQSLYGRTYFTATSSGNVTYAYGAVHDFVVVAGSTSTITDARGTYTSINLDDGTVGTVRANYSNIDIENAADVTGDAFLYQGAYQSGTTVNVDGTAYGVYINGEEDNYFSGSVGIGTTSPQSLLHVSNSNASLDTLGDGQHLRISGAGGVFPLFESTTNAEVQLRIKSDSTNRRIIALNSANVVQAQIVLEDNGEIHLAGATTAGADRRAIFDSIGLQVFGDIRITQTSPQLYLTETGSTGAAIDWSVVRDADNFNIRWENASPYAFSASTSGTSGIDNVSLLNEVYVLSSGDVGIGISNPASKVHIDDDAAVGTGLLVTGGGGGGGLATFTRDVGATGTVLINASGGDPQIRFDSASNGFAIGVDSSDFKISDHTAIGTNDRFTIDSTGDVGIGTTTPDYKLDIYETGLGGTAGDTLDLLQIHGGNGNQSYLNFQKIRTATGTDWTSAGTRIQQVIDVTAQGYIQFNGDGNNHGISFGKNTTEYMRIDTNGNVGIGTTSPSTKLDVDGSVRSIPHNIGTLTAASTTINFDNGNHQYFTINTTSAFTFNNPSNADVGIIGTIRIERGASVPSNFLFGTGWKFPSPGTVPEIEADLTTSGDYGYLDYYVHGATDIRVTWSGKVGA